MAHACADEEKLADALLWISRAIDELADDGDLLRFRASILERQGLIEAAYEEAEQARLRGADRLAIASDLARLRGKLVLALRERAGSDDLAVSLIGHAELLRMGELRPLALLPIAAKIAILPLRLLLQRLGRSIFPPPATAGGHRWIARGDMPGSAA